MTSRRRSSRPDARGGVRAPRPTRHRPIAGGTDLMVQLAAGRRGAAGASHRPVAARRAARHRVRRLRGHRSGRSRPTPSCATPRSSGLACRRWPRPPPPSAPRRSRTAARSAATSQRLAGRRLRCPCCSRSTPRSRSARRRASAAVRASDFWVGVPPDGAAPRRAAAAHRASRSSATATPASARSGTRQAQAISKVVMALSYQEDGGVWRDVRLALGSVAATTDPRRARPSRSSRARAARESVADHAAAVLADGAPADRRRALDGRLPPHGQRARPAPAAARGGRLVRSARRGGRSGGGLDDRRHPAGRAGHRRGAGRPAAHPRPEALAFVAALQRELGGRGARSCSSRGGGGGRRSPPAARSTSCPRPPPSATATGRSPRRPPTSSTAGSRSPGPAEPKMLINALNSGARVFMADLEDALSPTWAQRHRRPGDAPRRRPPRGRLHEPGGQALRPERGDRDARSSGPAAGTSSSATSWSTASRCRRASSTSACTSSTPAGQPSSAAPGPASAPTTTCPSSRSTSRRGSGTTSSSTARRRSASRAARSGRPCSSRRSAAAFEMEEILHELREHAAGLNAGRWDYIFSLIKAFRDRPDMVLPDRAQVTMAVPFMRAYTQAARARLPPPRRPRDRRHERVHPQPPRAGGDRERARPGPRGQGARGGRRLRRHLGRPSRPRAGRAGGLRPRPRRAAQPEGPAARGRGRVAARSCST